MQKLMHLPKVMNKNDLLGIKAVYKNKYMRNTKLQRKKNGRKKLIRDGKYQH